MAELFAWMLVCVTVFGGVTATKFPKSYTKMNRKVSCYSWTSWQDTDMTDCKGDCGNGVRVDRRIRTCKNLGFRGPFPSPGCSYRQVEETKVVCDTEIECTGDSGEWEEWEAAGSCDFCKTNKRKYTRTRSCEGGPCEGGTKETKFRSCPVSFYQRQLCYHCRDYRTFIFYYMLPVFHTCIYGNYQEITCPSSRGELYRRCDGAFNSPQCRIFFLIEMYCSSNSQRRW